MIKKSKLHKDLMLLSYPEYNLNTLFHKYDNYVLTKVLESTNKIKIGLFEEKFDDFYKVCYEGEEGILKEKLSKLDYTPYKDLRISDVCYEYAGEYDHICNETELIEVSDNIKDIDNIKDNDIIYIVHGYIAVDNLYKQFKGKSNFVDLIKYVRKEVGIINNEET